MKKIILLFSGILAIVSLNAQQNVVVQLTVATAAEIENSIVKPSNANFQKGGSEIFCEDFSNGYAGNNPYGAWTATDNGALGDVWEDGDASLSNGQYSTEPGLSSTTSANGYALFDADGYNTENNLYPATPSLTGYLTSPTINMSDLNSVVVSWEQYFRYCCYDFSPFTLQVSTDGGATWTLFDAHGDFTPDANVGSPNGQNVSVDISCVAAGQSAVNFRFAYNSELADIYETYGDGYSTYFWAIDDVCVSENPTLNDIIIDEVVNGDIFNLWEYFATPMEQKITEADGGLLVGTIMKNSGPTDIDNATLTIEILNEDLSTVLSTTVTENVSLLSPSNPMNCPSQKDSTYVSTGWEPDAIGVYWIRSTIGVDGVVDESPDNNTMMKKIEYTASQFGHDDRTGSQIELRAIETDGVLEPHGWGNIYHMSYDGSIAYGVNVMFGRHTEDNITVQVRFYQIEGGTALADTDFNEFFFDIAPSMIPSNSQGMIMTHLEFDDPIELEAGGVYFVGITFPDEGDQELTIRAEDVLDTDFSSRVFRVIAGDEYWFSMDQVPTVRMVLQSTVSVDEIAKPYTFSLTQNSPNPANDQTTVNYNLKKAEHVLFKIHDITGKLIQTLDQGTQTIGDHSITIDLNDLAEGVYEYTMIVNDKKITKKLIVGK